jgi:tRNA-dihydrouridine synthase B
MPKNFWHNISKPILCLAPLAGISDSPFRLICKKQGADIVYSEMASAAALYYNPEKTLKLLQFSNQEQPYIVQLFGNDPKYFKKATQIISKGLPQIDYLKKKSIVPKAFAPPAGIDINLGCPAKKVFQHGSGASLMKNPTLVIKIIQAVTKNTSLPVSLKLRTKVEHNPQQANWPLPNNKQNKIVDLLSFLKQINVNNLGITALMIHGRTYKQGFTGEIDYETLKATKQSFIGIVIANGNIHNLDNAKQTLKKTKADGLGIATGSYGNPFLFREIQQFYTNKQKNLPSLKATSAKIDIHLKIKIALTHARYAYQYKKERGIIEMRKHLLWYLKGFPNIRKFYPKIVNVSSLKDIETLVHQLIKAY